MFCFTVQFLSDHWGPREGLNHLSNEPLTPRELGGMCSLEGLLTRLVFLPLGDDSQGVHVEPQVPGHSLQQDHREGPVGVSVVDEGANLPGLQPVPPHVTLSMECGNGHFCCGREGQEWGDFQPWSPGRWCR